MLYSCRIKIISGLRLITSHNNLTEISCPALSGLYHCTWDSRGYLSCFSEQEECGVHLLKGKLVFLAGEDSEGDKMGAVLEIGGARCDTVTHCPRDTRCLLGRLGIFCKT